MSRGFHMGGAGGGNEKYLYNKGTWSIGYDNPGGYVWGSAQLSPYTLETEKMVAPSNQANMIGTTRSLDLSKNSTLHVLAKGFALYGGTTCRFCVGSSKNVSNIIRYNDVTTLNMEVEYTLDVSDLVGGFLYFYSQTNASCEIYKIWLT